MATTVYNGGYQTSSGTANTVSLGPVTYGAGSNGAYLTTGSTGTTWTQPNTHFNNAAGTAVMSIPHGDSKVVIEEKAELEVKGRVKINGVDLEERLQTIERVLAIPERDVILESKHPRLKELYDEYINTLAKYRTWESLKGSE